MLVRRATLHQLKIFHTLARHLSVSRTAEALHLTPPAVSIQVKQLAEAVGQPLIEQIGKQIHLTPAGETVAAACRDIFERLDRLSEELAAHQGLEKGNVNLAIITTSKYFVPRLLGDFIDRYPGIDTALFVGNRRAVLERLGENRDDLYVLGQPPENARVIAVPFAPNPLVAIAWPGHPLAGVPAIPPARLGEEPFIAREQGSGTRLTYEEFFRSQGVKLDIRMELGSHEAIKQMVEARLGISVLSRSTVRGELLREELVLLDVQGLPLERQWYVVYPQQKRLSPAAEMFRSFLCGEEKGEGQD